VPVNIFFFLCRSSSYFRAVRGVGTGAASARGLDFHPGRRFGLDYTPANLPSGKVFTLTIRSAAQSLDGQNIDAWLQARAQADLRQRGTGVSATPAHHAASDLYVILVPYRDSKGQSWSAIYAAIERPGGAEYCTMLSNLPQQPMQTYVQSGAQIFTQAVALARNDGGSRTTSTAVNAASAPAAGMASGNLTTSQQSGLLPDSQIAGLLHVGRGMTTASGYQYVEQVDLLLSDGWAYSGLTGPPEGLDVEASKHAEPQKWHSWRQQNGAVYLQMNGGWTRLDADIVRPLESGSALSKNLVHRNATTFVGMGGAVGTDRISFRPDGRFERSANVLSGSGAVQFAGGFSGGASSLTNRYGTTSMAAGTYASPGGSVTARSSRSGAGGAGATTGTYKVTGFTLELDCANGQVQRLLAFYPFPAKPQIFIGSVTFNAE
jgi:hypothetical protein